MAACFGSGGQQVAGDEKFSAENDSGEEEEEEKSKRKVGAKRAGEGTIATNPENNDGGMEARAEADRQAGSAGTEAQNGAGGWAEDQSFLPPLPGSPPRRWNTA